MGLRVGMWRGPVPWLQTLAVLLQLNVATAVHHDTEIDRLKAQSKEWADTVANLERELIQTRAELSSAATGDRHASDPCGISSKLNATVTTRPVASESLSGVSSTAQVFIMSGSPDTRSRSRSKEWGALDMLANILGHVLECRASIFANSIEITYNWQLHR